MNIHIPTPLRSFTAGAETVAVPGTTVAEVFTNLTTRYPELQQQLFNTEGKLRSFVNVYLNDEDLRYLPSREATTVAATDELTIIPSIAGGAGRTGESASREDSLCSCCPLL
ncbi:MoaD/ThiS family protein [Edaphobacter modestus]|uniref:Molybdopterin synthase subunit MoaD n=1 Tax=Edaphobacter modestus TaxID=388466 RepID=A0A4Q7YRX1_9BACT|nr:MoaD/ThiS family protein [Edaphobacter modestus]RZU40552.1 molybdopterin synthase subunit MoaD [Edaphobacter modestus]